MVTTFQLAGHQFSEANAAANWGAALWHHDLARRSSQLWWTVGEEGGPVDDCRVGNVAVARQTIATDGEVV